MGSVRTISLGFWFLLVTFLLVVLIAPALFMRAAMAPYLYSEVRDVPETSAILVLGASVVQGRPSPILAERTEAAKELYHEGKAHVILVTGAVDGKYDEVTPMRKFLIEGGVRAEDIATDSAGVDTFSSMYRARHVFLADSLIVVTQDFHLPRAVFLARALNIRAYGLAVSKAGTFFDYMREIPASWKAIFDVITHGEPSPETPLAPIVISGIAAR